MNHTTNLPEDIIESNTIPPTVYRRSCGGNKFSLPEDYVVLIGYISSAINANGVQVCWYVDKRRPIALLANNKLNQNIFDLIRRSSVNNVTEDDLNDNPSGGGVNIPTNLPNDCYAPLNKSEEVILRLIHPQNSELETPCVAVLPAAWYDSINYEDSYNSVFYDIIYVGRDLSDKMNNYSHGNEEPTSFGEIDADGITGVNSQSFAARIDDIDSL